MRIVSLFLLFTCGLAADLSAAERPNILFIYTDDQSYRTISCYPEARDFVKTPNIDALAERGMRFTHAYMGTWCMPSRATVLTGRLQFGVESMRMQGTYPDSTYDPAVCRFWPSVFREQGYTTAHIGKWHTGRDAGYGRDWDHQIVWNRPAHPENSGAYYYDQMISTNGADAVLVKGYSTDNYTAWAQDYIKGDGRDADKPWALWLCYGGVHGPFTPAERHLDAMPYGEPEIEEPVDLFGPRTGKPGYVQKQGKWEKDQWGRASLKGYKGITVKAKGIHGNAISDWVRQYNEAVIALDEGVGKIMADLKASGQLDNTMIIFTSDQGFAWGQHGFRHKLAPYDANIRVPFIVSYPRLIPEGSVCERPIGGQDIAPTLAAIAGVEIPWSMHGHDLTPLLKDPETRWRHHVLMALTGRLYGSDTDTIPADSAGLTPSGIPWWISLTKGRTKYIRTLQAGEVEELYDLDEDPEELRNLALEKEFQPILSAFRESTHAELRRTEAGFRDSLPPAATEK